MLKVGASSNGKRHDAHFHFRRLTMFLQSTSMMVSLRQEQMIYPLLHCGLTNRRGIPLFLLAKLKKCFFSGTGMLQFGSYFCLLDAEYRRFCFLEMNDVIHVLC